MKKVEGYLSVGKDIIEPEKFKPIINTEKQKPEGGFWATKHELKCICYNPWMDYITEHPHLIFYKYPDNYPVIPAVFFTLKSEANILNIESAEQYLELKKEYPGQNDNIDFELLSEFYDGVFISIPALSRKKETDDADKEFSVSSLILFNLNCIESYRQASIFIELDRKHGFDFYEYNIVPKRKTYTIENGPVLTRQKKGVK